MDKPSARVLSLPTVADAREEAQRMGVPPSRLEKLVEGLGTEPVKLTGVPVEVASVLEQAVSSHRGVAVATSSVANGPQPEAGDQQPEQTTGPNLFQREMEIGAVSTEEMEAARPSAVDYECSDLLLAAPRSLLLELASQLAGADTDAEKQVGAELRAALEHHRGRNLGTTACGNLTFEWGKRTYVMGIINATPDSFSGDGLHMDVDAAVAQARRFVDEGADILDVGGESTRPGSKPVSVQEEIDRVIPVIRRLVAELPVPVSIDSYKLLVVQEALEAGARMVNDVWGLRRTEGLGSLAAAYGVPIVLMHNRRADASSGKLGGHFKKVEYRDLMGEIYRDLQESVELALRSNVKWENIIVDPGIGFGKTPEQNLVVMRRLRELKSMGRPILMGTSRKSVIGLTLGVPMEERLEGTGATVAVSICNGADIVRVHDVKEMARVAKMTDAIIRVSNE